MVYKSANKSGAEKDNFNQDYLPINSKIDKYFVQNIVSADDESAIYLCKNSKGDKQYYIREFFPKSISYRDDKDGSIYPLCGMEVKYKTLAEDFECLFEKIQSMENNPILQKIIEIVNKNNTIYIIFDCDETITLKEYVSNRKEKIQWTEIKPNFMQLCQGISDIHVQGILHRGISDTNIYVNSQNKFILKCFSTVSNRTMNSEINGTLFENFSAPEQYNPSQWQGNWTDVYSLGALLYFILTGNPPEKKDDGTILTLDEVDNKIPQYISDAVSAAMVENCEFRVQNVDEFTAMLLDDVSSNTMIFSAPMAEESIKILEYNDDNIHGTTLAPMFEKSQVNEKSNESRFYGYFSMFILLLFYVLMSSEIKSNPVVIPIEKYIFVPFQSYNIESFIGQKADEILNNTEITKKYKFIVRQEYNETYNKGEVFAQSPRGGVKAVNKANIIISVSKGKRTSIMPDIIGKDIEEAKTILDRYAINYKILEMIDEKLMAGIVTNTSVEAGATVDKFKDTVYLFVVKNVENKSENTSSSSSESSEEENEEKPNSRNDEY
ncbi:MAG: PASTA domain-containing protein [Oscillospiraceae bacterium]